MPREPAPRLLNAYWMGVVATQTRRELYRDW